MCALLLKPFVLGYILVGALLQLLIYFKIIKLVPRAMDNGFMLAFLVAISMSQRLTLGCSVIKRLLILGLLHLAFYAASKLVFPGQYKSLLTIKDGGAYRKLLDEGESLDEKRDIFTLKSRKSREKVEELLSQEKRPIFELLMAGLLAGLFIYFLMN